MKNALYYGDNLPIMRQRIADESIDLVYLDPPFKSDQNYNVLFGEHGVQSAAQIQAFEDTWQWDQAAAEAYQEVVEGSDRVSMAMQGFRTLLGTSDMLAYLSMMAPRLVELRRVLKATGSIYLHCDPTASHYLKILMDAVFGPTNFRNEIAWKRTNARSTQDRWPRIHDILLFYSKTETFCFRSLKTKADQAKLPHTLITGADGKKYQTYELTAPGTTKKGDSGKPWRGYNPTAMGRHWADSHAKRNEWDKQGLIHWPKPGTAGGFPRRRAKEPFDPGAREITVADVWIDIDRINQTAKERLGYPTQKPEALLERIITASSSEGDTVLDPFCGCGTAIAAAEKLHRRWVGIDITYLAVSLIKKRLFDAFDIMPNGSFDVIGEPITADDAERLAAENSYQFQWWALDLVGAAPARDEKRKGADKGIDGRIFFHDEGPSGKTKQIIVSVKAGTLHVTHVRDLVGVVNREEAAIGVLISMRQATKAMRTETASAGFYQSPWGSEGTKHPRIQLFTVAELLAGKQIDMPPCRDLRTYKKAPRARAKSGHRQPKMF